MKTMTLFVAVLLLSGCTQLFQDTACELPEPDVHRAVADTCDDMRPPGYSPLDPAEMSPEVECQTDADCTDGTNGRCSNLGRGYITCTYDECSTDAACGDGVCHCEGGWGADNNVCKVEGNCQVDSDCGPGGYCSPSFGSCGAYGGIVGWFCHTCEDECTNDSDCGGPYGHCAYDGEKWACSDAMCVG